MKRIIISVLALFAVLTAVQAKTTDIVLKSPDGKTSVNIVAGGPSLSYSVTRGGLEVLSPSELAMTIRTSGKSGDKDVVTGGSVKKVKNGKIDNVLHPEFYKYSSLKESYNEVTLTLNDGFGVVFRAYDEGVAYRFFSTAVKAGDKVIGEVAQYNFSKDYHAYVPYSNGQQGQNPYQCSFESKYTYTPISGFRTDWPAFSPLLVCLDGGMKVAITESDLESYPGMFLRKNLDKENALYGAFANIPSETEMDRMHRQVKAVAYSDIQAEIHKSASKSAPRYFPWRVLAISDKDTQLAENPIVWLLGAENRIGDTSWIKPGMVAWDYWNNWGLSGVDFKSGLNTETWKYYIDFASKNGIEYVVLDEGWNPEREADLTLVSPGVDLEELVRFAKEKNVGLFLWAISYTLDKQLEEVCQKYSAMGIKGFKVDFIDRDDQQAVEMNYRIAETCAKYHLLLDLHGMYKPAGFNRTFPHVLNYEGVWGLENMKWSTDDIIEYDVTYPYIRMLAGPLDYTQGAMRSVGQPRRGRNGVSGFVPSFSYPSSQGTRSHQVAMYAVLDSPLAMLADSPSAYMKEQETTDFIVRFPTTWDETRVLQGEVGQFIVTARRKGNKWYVGGLNGWTARDIVLDLGFTGSKTVEIYKDGINVDKIPVDYKLEKVELSGPVTIHMAPGGGFAAIIE